MTHHAVLGIIGTDHLNVLQLNIALDHLPSGTTEACAGHCRGPITGHAHRNRYDRNGGALPPRSFYGPAPWRANGADARPDPDALLAHAERGQRGHLKIFLGAAPGVGKTWEMLVAANAKRKAGVDVVAGLIETHGRSGTLSEIRDLEVLPRCKVPYRGQELEEFDLDAALARRPALLLIDELAHTNAPGLRHAKRWQDVQDVLEAGIDVWTTVNVQHLESLNDPVARITGMRVAETIPDTVLDMADEIELIDLAAGRTARPPHRRPDLPARRRRPRAPGLFPRRQSRRPARNGAAPRRAARRQGRHHLYARPRHSRPLAGERARDGPDRLR